MAPGKSSVFLAGLGGAVLGAVIVTSITASSRDEPAPARARMASLERSVLRLEDVLARLDQSINELVPVHDVGADSPLAERVSGASAREPLVAAAGEEGIVEHPPDLTLAKLAAVPKDTELLVRLAHHRSVEGKNDGVQRGRETWANVTAGYRLLSLRDILERFGSPDSVYGERSGSGHLRVTYHYRVGERVHYLKFLLHDLLVVYAGAR